jgi:hypothetical protein
MPRGDSVEQGTRRIHWTAVYTVFHAARYWPAPPADEHRSAENPNTPDLVMEAKEKQYSLAESEIARHLEDSTISKAAHFATADKYASLERAIQWVSAVSFAGIVVSWFVSTQIYAVIEAFGGTVASGWKTATQVAVPIGFAAANVVATALLYLNRFGDRARSHREAAQRYQWLFRKCTNWRTDAPDSSFAEKAASIATRLRDELSDANHDSPDLEEWAWAAAHKQIDKGGTDYSTDHSA